MEKFIIINDAVGAFKVYVGADIVHAELTGTTPNIFITLNYADKQVVLEQNTGDFVQADVDLLNSKIVEVWSQGYTNSTIGPVALSQLAFDVP